MDAVSSSTVHSRAKNVEDFLTIEDINADIAAFLEENFNLTQTAEVLERYLRKRTPVSLVGMERFLDSYSTVRSSFLQIQMQVPARSSSCSSRSSPSPSPGETLVRGSTTSSGTRGIAGPRSNPQSSSGSYKISPLVKADIVEKELEENRATMDKLEKKFESAKFLLQTEEENLRIDIDSLQKSKKALEEFLSKNTDSKSGKVVYDRFFRYMDQELRTADRFLRNTKLKTKSLHSEYKRFQAQQQQRMELRERLHCIDIDKLLIENQELLDVMEVRNENFEDLKKVVGKKGQTLVMFKSRLNDIAVSLKSVKQDSNVKGMKCKYIGEQEIQNQNMLRAAEDTNQTMKNLNMEFKSPDVHDYLLVQRNLQELKLEKENWERRCKYQKQQILMLEHQLKQLCPTPRSHSWRGRTTAYSLPSVKKASERLQLEAKKLSE